MISFLIVDETFAVIDVHMKFMVIIICVLNIL